MSTDIEKQEAVLAVMRSALNRNKELHHENQTLRERVRELEDNSYHENVLKAVESLKYIQGIVERGTGVKLSDNEPIDEAILAYVKYLENRTGKAEATIKELAGVLDVEEICAHLGDSQRRDIPLIRAYIKRVQTALSKLRTDWPGLVE